MILYLKLLNDSCFAETGAFISIPSQTAMTSLHLRSI